MAVAMLRDLKYVVGSLLGKGEVMQDLEYSMRTKGDLTRLEEARLRAFSGIATRGFATGAAIYSFMGWFMTGSGAFLTGKLMYYIALRMCAQLILEVYDPEDRMKMELANMHEYLLSIVMTNHWLKL
ncbi:uncharacterized protein LOC101768916 [Setaria italica]|uniref:uncharacterized protein LOC101768916 n=1 Tax=Setaria italica TaxID=4555 RepID=UPI000350C8A4|nr:uncharacterized protein LOC101768916 [Setaria italica]